MSHLHRLPLALLFLVLPLAAASPTPTVAPVFLAEWGSLCDTESSGSGGCDGQFNYPLGGGVDANGNVYVADTLNERIQKFDSSGVFLNKWGQLGVGDGDFQDAYDVAVYASSNVYVADASNHRIQKFNSSGAFQTKWGTFCDIGSSGVDGCDGNFNAPYGVAVDRLGMVYVADYYNHRIQKFDADGTFLAKWGTRCNTGVSGLDACDGKFNYPHDVAIDASGNMFVADSGNHRIQKLDSSGTFVLRIGGVHGGADGEFRNPQGVAVDVRGNVYVADSSNNRIQMFDNDGTFLAKWGIPGSGDTEFQNPYRVMVDAAGNVYVADSFNHRMQKFGTFLEILVVEPEPLVGR